MGAKAARSKYWRVAQIALSLVIFVVVCIYVWWRFNSEWHQLLNDGLQFRYDFLLLALALVAANNFLRGVAWYLVVRFMGRKFSFRRTFSIFVIPQLIRHIPGGVWGHAGMAYLAKRSGLEMREAVSASVILLLTGLTVGMIVFAASPVYNSDGTDSWDWAIFVAVPAGLIVLYPRLFFKIRNLILVAMKKEPVERRMRYHHLLCILAMQGATWMVSGFMLRFVIRSFYGYAPDVFVLAGVYAISWCAGFVVLMVPDGLGVREAMIALLLGPYNIDSAIAVGASMVVRVLQILGDLLLAVLGAIFWKISGAKVRRLLAERAEDG